MKILPKILDEVGGKLLWQLPTLGQPVGSQATDEILGIWYPSHKSFLALPIALSSVENFRIKNLCVSEAVRTRAYCYSGCLGSFMQGPMLKALRRFTQLLRVHIYVPGCCKYIRMANGLQPLAELCLDGCFADQPDFAFL